ncbi:MAG TPA: SDR family oxidoreductase [Candidatus Limnocylindrales bacterium]|nr:SDR family oxidoreductase [Candidatus Limnocylindrales bacterium]
MYLVVGATGMVGGAVCARLAAAGRPVRALVRASSDPAKVQRLREAGVETVVGDLREPGSLDAACVGIDAVVATVSAMPFSYAAGVNDIETTDRQGMLELVRAAAGAGVRHFSYLSFSGNLDRDFPLRNAKREVEGALARSGIEHTILRPSCFMEVWLGPAVGFDPANGAATIYGSGEAPISWIATSDVAAFAVASLTHPAARNAILELGGPRPIPPLEAVRIFETAFGRPIAVSHVPVEALDAQVAAAVDPMQRSFAGLMRCCADGDAIEMGSTSGLLDEPLTTVEAFAGQVAAAAATPV